MDHYFINNESLESKLKKIKYEILGSSFEFTTDIGVFSKDKVDKGSDLLINSYLGSHHKSLSILDVGCGYGVIGITIGLMTGSKVDMVDINKRSVHLTKMNIKRLKCDAKAFYSDAYSRVIKKYDVIITNPPIRVGNEKLFEILLGAKKHLKKNGELWFVISKNQGAGSVMKKLNNEYFIEIKMKKKGYFVFCAKSR